MYKIIILDSIHNRYDEEKQVFSKLNRQLVIEASFDKKKIIDSCKEADAVAVNLQTMDREIIATLKRCKIISRYGVGYDNIDLKAANANNIIVCNCNNYCGEETSDQAMAHLLNLTRQIGNRKHLIRSGKWGNQIQSPIRSIQDQTIGIVGLGESGKKFLRKIKSFHPLKILVCDPSKSPKVIDKLGGQQVDFQALIRHSDIISLHLPLKPETTYLFCDKVFKLMKPSALLINTSRGKIIDEQALVEALRQHEIAGAGLDVFETEPLPLNSPLLDLPQLSLSDHSSWYSPASMSRLKTICATNISNALTGKKVYNTVK